MKIMTSIFSCDTAADTATMATTSVYNEKLFDVFISYALEDADLVEANLAANLEHGATSYRSTVLLI